MPTCFVDMSSVQNVYVMYIYIVLNNMMICQYVLLNKILQHQNKDIFLFIQNKDFFLSNIIARQQHHSKCCNELIPIFPFQVHCIGVCKHMYSLSMTTFKYTCIMLHNIQNILIIFSVLKPLLEKYTSHLTYWYRNVHANKSSRYWESYFKEWKWDKSVNPFMKSKWFWKRMLMNKYRETLTDSTGAFLKLRQMIML